MGLENKYFRKDFHYRNKIVNRCLLIIKFSKDEKRVRAFKNFVFKMMKIVVKKNVSNHINMLKTVKNADVPERDELVAECYIMFDKCIEKYKVCKKNNFYFYFNKSMSRNFFRIYQKLVRNSTVELTDAMQIVHPHLQEAENPDTMEALLSSLGLTELEKRVCRSKLIGQKSSEFVQENPDVSSSEYSTAMRKIKEVLAILIERGEI